VIHSFSCRGNLLFVGTLEVISSKFLTPRVAATD
jgi:hypothetical protein